MTWRAPRELTPSDLTVGQEVRVFNANGKRVGQPEGGWVGTVEKIGRKLVTLQWPGRYSYSSGQFRLDTRQANDQYGHDWFRTIEEADAERRQAEDRQVLRDAGVTIEYRSNLTAEQVSELAALVRGWSS